MIRRLHRTVVVEYVTDRPDDELRVLSIEDFGASRFVSDVIAVIDADVTPEIALAEADQDVKL